jgi:hypothetical protein
MWLIGLSPVPSLGWQRVRQREPARTFSDTDVQHAGRRLAELIERRCGDDP